MRGDSESSDGAISLSSVNFDSRVLNRFSIVVLKWSLRVVIQSAKGEGEAARTPPPAAAEQECYFKLCAD